MLLRSKCQQAYTDYDLDLLSGVSSKIDSTLRHGGYIKEGYLVPGKWLNCMDSSSTLAKCKKNEKEHFCQLRSFLTTWKEQDSFYQEMSPMAKAGGFRVLISDFGMKHEFYELYYFTLMAAVVTKPD